MPVVNLIGIRKIQVLSMGFFIMEEQTKQVIKSTSLFAKLVKELLMAELLKALMDEDCGRINRLAQDLFITPRGYTDRAQINEFEKYAPCKVEPVVRDALMWVMGEIVYNGKRYLYG